MSRRILITVCAAAALALTVPATSQARVPSPLNCSVTACTGKSLPSGYWSPRTPGVRKALPPHWWSKRTPGFRKAWSPGWTFVSQEFADALAEGESSPPENADTRQWERCRTNRSHTVVICPDGFITRF